MKLFKTLLLTLGFLGCVWGNSAHAWGHISKAADENPSGPAPTVMMASLMNWGHLS